MPLLTKNLFKRPKIALEGEETIIKKQKGGLPDEIMKACPQCKTASFLSDLEEALDICPECGHHFRIDARRRIALTADAFVEMDADCASKDIIGFAGYENKLAAAMEASGEKEAVLTGVGQIGTVRCALFAMSALFMMGSMGVVVGDKITRLFEYATKERLPVVGFTVSGGARMQEGILSLMQMAKTSAAVMRHSQAGLLYITVLTDPTTGGVTASFGMQGDIILAEPNALIGFAGPRVIEQTIRQKLPKGFQRAELLLEKGFVDAIVHRQHMRQTLETLLQYHAQGEGLCAHTND